jgi:hypothetical protein
MVDVRYASELPRFISLAELKTHAQGALKDMALFARSRLSVQPVTDGMGPVAARRLPTCTRYKFLVVLDYYCSAMGIHTRTSEFGEITKSPIDAWEERL